MDLGQDEVVDGLDLFLEFFVQVVEAGRAADVGDVDLDARDGLLRLLERGLAHAEAAVEEGGARLLLGLVVHAGGAGKKGGSLLGGWVLLGWVRCVPAVYRLPVSHWLCVSQAYCIL